MSSNRVKWWNSEAPHWLQRVVLAGFIALSIVFSWLAIHAVNLSAYDMQTIASKQTVDNFELHWLLEGLQFVSFFAIYAAVSLCLGAKFYTRMKSDGTKI